MSLIRRCSIPLVLVATGLVACSGGDDKTVDPPNVDPLEIVTDMLPDGAFGVAYDQKIGARGGEAPYVFSIGAGALPGGLMIKADTGQISGMASIGGTFEFSVKVTDKGGREKSKDFSIYVVPDTLSIATNDLPDNQTDVFYDATLEASGGVMPYTWTLTEGMLPGGVALGTSGRISGTPTRSGLFEIRIVVTDAEGNTADRMFVFTIRSADPLITTSPTLDYARFGDPYDVTLTVDGGAPPYTWSIIMGALPTGMTMSAEGHITGSPEDFGEFRFGVRVTDADAKTDEVELVLIALGPLAITTTSLPLAIYNEPYSQQLEAEGGLEPYRWILAPQTPAPMGITLSETGILSGTPTEEGDFSLRIRLQDDTGVLARSAMLFLRVRDLRVYTTATAATFPPVCTSTHVSYQTVEMQVPDSFSIQDINVTLDIDYTDSSDANSNDKLRLMLAGPDGRQAIFCGNSTGVRGGQGCPGTEGVQATYGPLGVPAQRTLSAFHGTNAQGTWRLRVAVVRPTTDGGGTCQQAGMINGFTMTLTPDTSSDPYIVVTGFHPNNLLLEPWVRITGGGQAGTNELFLAATLWDVGANGRREAGRGDDVPDPRSFTWTGTGLPPGVAITTDGHVTTGGITGRGILPTITASDGGSNIIAMPLHVVPPDWNPDVREF